MFKPHLDKVLNEACGALQPGALQYGGLQTSRSSRFVAKAMKPKHIHHILRSIKPYLDYSVEKLDASNPPVWGPGLVEPPGGPDFANRYAFYQQYQHCAKL